MIVKKTLLTVMFCLSSLSLAHAQFGETRVYFKDWLAACRPDGYCSATVYDNANSQAGVADYIFRVGRHPTSTYWELSFTGVKAYPDRWQDLNIDIDDTTISFSGAEEFGAYQSINDFFLLGTKAQNLFDLMGPGKTFLAHFTHESETQYTATFSLEGLNAALLWIDEQQKRLGAERVAFAPPHGLLPSGNPGAGAVPPELVELHRANTQCEELETLANARDTITAQLDDEHTLYLLPCFAGAYNFGALAYIRSPYAIEPIYFASYSESHGWTGTPFLVNAFYESETRQLSAYYKGRGIGDCGTFGTWIWQDYGFKLLEYRAKSECDGEPGDFPIVYSAPDYVSNE